MGDRASLPMCHEWAFVQCLYCDYFLHAAAALDISLTSMPPQQTMLLSTSPGALFFTLSQYDIFMYIVYVLSLFMIM